MTMGSRKAGKLLEVIERRIRLLEGFEEANRHAFSQNLVLDVEHHMVAKWKNLRYPHACPIQQNASCLEQWSSSCHQCDSAMRKI
jgi:hypothetical protein